MLYERAYESIDAVKRVDVNERRRVHANKRERVDVKEQAASILYERADDVDENIDAVDYQCYTSVQSK